MQTSLTPSREERALLWLTQSALMNFGAALSMWAADNEGSYPARLDLLSPNYLRRVPAGPGGSKDDWVYETAGDFYAVSNRAAVFSGQGLEPGFPRYDSLRGLQPAREDASDLDYPFRLPADLPGTWEKAGPRAWKCGEQHLQFRLGGPTRIGQSGEDWVREQASSVWGDLESESPVQLGQLTGIELRTRYHDFRSHRFVLSDGVLGWEFVYGAGPGEFSEAVDAAFVAMLPHRGAESPG